MKVVSVVLQEHEGLPCNSPYHISPLQMVSQGAEGCLPQQGPRVVLRLLCPCQVLPAGGSSTIYISFTPVVLDPEHSQKLECCGYALGFMSLDKEVSCLEGTLGHCFFLGSEVACLA